MDYLNSKTPQFNTSLAFTLSQEGGYTVDQGGPTMRGIEQREYDIYRRQNDLPDKPVLFISNDEVYTIYHNNYWLPIHGDYIHMPICTVLFDTAVNMGVSRALGFLLLTLGMDVTGFEATWITKNSAAYWNDTDIKAGNYLKFCEDYLSHRRTYYEYLDRIFPQDERGWLNRVNALSEFCKKNS